MLKADDQSLRLNLASNQPTNPSDTVNESLKAIP
jgi:hypothetical protein